MIDRFQEECERDCVRCVLTLLMGSISVRCASLRIADTTLLPAVLLLHLACCVSTLCLSAHLLSLSAQHTLQTYGSLQELLDKELLYVAQQIQRAPDNESAWNYLWGLFALPGCPQHEMGRQQNVSCVLVVQRLCWQLCRTRRLFCDGLDLPADDRVCLRVLCYAGAHHLQGGPC